jgi:probable rRNA maturation factor
MILNRQKTVRLSTRMLAGFLQKIQRELKLENVEVSIAFVTDEEIARWNESYRQEKGPTDVLSFPAAARPKTQTPAYVTHKRKNAMGVMEPFLGDIAIAPETARRYAKQKGRTLESELRVLMLHGVLHLMGYDHESDNDQMNRIEHRVRRRLGIA